MLKRELQGGEQKQEGEDMSFTKSGRTYYSTRREVEQAKRKGDTVRYSKKHRAYYIVRTYRTPSIFFSRWF